MRSAPVSVLARVFAVPTLLAAFAVPVLLAAGCARHAVQLIGWPPHEPRPEGHPVEVFLSLTAGDDVRAAFGRVARPESQMPEDALGIADLRVRDDAFTDVGGVLEEAGRVTRAVGGDAVLVEAIERNIAGGDWVYMRAFRYHAR